MDKHACATNVFKTTGTEKQTLLVQKLSERRTDGLTTAHLEQQKNTTRNPCAHISQEIATKPNVTNMNKPIATLVTFVETIVFRVCGFCTKLWNLRQYLRNSNWYQHFPANSKLNHRCFCTHLKPFARIHIFGCILWKPVFEELTSYCMYRTPPRKIANQIFVFAIGGTQPKHPNGQNEAQCQSA